jgi:hypothetical protein
MAIWSWAGAYALFNWAEMGSVHVLGWGQRENLRASFRASVTIIGVSCTHRLHEIRPCWSKVHDEGARAGFRATRFAPPASLLAPILQSTNYQGDAYQIIWVALPQTRGRGVLIFRRIIHGTRRDRPGHKSSYVGIDTRVWYIHVTQPNLHRLTLPLNHNLSKLRLRRNVSSCRVDSDFVNPSATW